MYVVKAFIKDHKRYMIKPKFLIEDGELDDLLCSLTLTNILNKDAKIFRQVPDDDPDYVNYLATRYYKNNVDSVTERIRYIHETNKKLDPKVTLLNDKFNRHIIKNMGAAAYAFLNLRNSSNSDLTYDKYFELMNEYISKKIEAMPERRMAVTGGMGRLDGSKRTLTKVIKSKKSKKLKKHIKKRKHTKKRKLKRRKHTKKRR